MKSLAISEKLWDNGLLLATHFTIAVPNVYVGGVGGELKWFLLVPISNLRIMLCGSLPTQPAGRKAGSGSAEIEMLASIRTSPPHRQITNQVKLDCC